MAAALIERLALPRAAPLVAVTLVTAAVLLGLPAVGSAAGAARPLSAATRPPSRGEVRRERALAVWLAPQLRRYERELWLVQARIAQSDVPSPVASFGGPLAVGGDRGSAAAGSMPASVAALVSTTRKLIGPARRALSDLVSDINDGAFTSPSGIVSAVSQIVGVLDPTTIPIGKLKSETALVIQQLASQLPPVSLAVGAGQAAGSCPSSEDPIDCWILQGENGSNLSSWLGYANIDASLVGMILGVGEIAGGVDTPLTIAADVAAAGTSVAQFYVDLVRRAGYGDSVVNKVVSVFLDGASVGTSVFDLGLLGDSLRLKAADEAVEAAAPTVEEVVDALHKVVPAGENIDEGVELIDLMAKLSDAKTALKAETQAKTIVGVLLTIFTTYNGPESSWLHRLARYLANHVRAALGSGPPVHHPTSRACGAINSAGVGLGPIVATNTSCATARAVARPAESDYMGAPYRVDGFSCAARGTSEPVGEVFHFTCIDGAMKVTFDYTPT